MDEIRDEFAKRDSDVMSAFGFRLKNQFSVNEAHRRPKELEWLESLRQYKGLYDPDVKIQEGNSRVYPKITRSKVNIVLSRLHEMLFPDTDKNWEITPTPEPTISREKVIKIAQSLSKQDEETGELVPPTEEELYIGIQNFAKETAKLMENVMDDQFLEMDYAEETKKVLRSGLMYGTGIMKGVLINAHKKHHWVPVDGGDYAEETATADAPFYEFVRLWDWYPDMTVTEAAKAEGFYERHVMTKHDLRELAKREDFFGDIILEFLKESPSGNYVAKPWEVDLQVIEVESGSGKNTKATVSGVVAADEKSRSTNRQLGKKYEVLEHWGYVDGSDLEGCGIEIPDVSLEYSANVWILGNKIIKAKLYDGALDMYKIFYYEKDETSIFGEGLARVMRHSQLAVAAASRMALDNGAVTAGPQVEVNLSLVSPDTDVNSFYSRKIWYREGKGVEAQYPAIRGLEFTSHIPELISIIELFKSFGDEETTLPTWLIGQTSNNETAQATSGRMSMVTISIKDVVKNFDAFTEKIINDLYAWNMDFNPRMDIKGDFKCNPRGVASLVMKEIRMQALNQLSTTLTEEDWIYIDRREFLAEKFKAHDVRINLRTEEEADVIRQRQSESLEMQLAIEKEKAEIAYKKAQTAAQLTKAKAKNVEAEKEAQTPIEGAQPAEDMALKRAEGESKIRREDEKHVLSLDQQRAKGELDIVKGLQDMDLKERQTAASIAAKRRPKKAVPR